MVDLIIQQLYGIIWLEFSLYRHNFEVRIAKYFEYLQEDSKKIVEKLKKKKYQPILISILFICHFLWKFIRETFFHKLSQYPLNYRVHLDEEMDDEFSSLLSALMVYVCCLQSVRLCIAFSQNYVKHPLSIKN